MPLQAGWLREGRIEVYRPTEEFDGLQRVPGEPERLGGFSASWAPTSDAERFRGAETQATVVYRFLIRSTEATRAIDPTYHLTFAGRSFGIAKAEPAVQWRGVRLRLGEAIEISATARAERPRP